MSPRTIQSFESTRWRSSVVVTGAAAFVVARIVVVGLGVVMGILRGEVTGQSGADVDLAAALWAQNSEMEWTDGC